MRCRWLASLWSSQHYHIPLEDYMVILQAKIVQLNTCEMIIIQNHIVAVNSHLN